MKRFFFLALMAVVTMTASAQIESGFRIGITAGGTLSTATELNDSKFLLGYRAGLVAEYNFSENVYLGSGIEYVMKGAKSDRVDGNLTFKFLQVPVNLGGRFSLSDNTYLFGQVGPYVGYAFTWSDIEVYRSSVIEATKFDWGFNAKIGVEFSRFQIHAGSELGMNNIWEGSAKHRSINFGLTYMF